MMLKEIGMLAVSSTRTKIYLQEMAKHQVLPSCVYYLSSSESETPEQRALTHIDRNQTAPQADISEYQLDISVPELLDMYKIPFQRLETLDPNSDLVVEAIQACHHSILIYSGPGGAILRKNILSTEKQFLHVHSGILPFYRGSTTAYYSLLNDGNCGATAFFIDPKIDTGPIILKRTYPAPEDRTTIDHFYDPLIRARLLVEVLQEYARNGIMPSEVQDIANGETYFIIHPVLKHIAILASEEK